MCGNTKKNGVTTRKRNVGVGFRSCGRCGNMKCKLDGQIMIQIKWDTLHNSLYTRMLQLQKSALKA